MKTYVVLLRGVNVGGHSVLPMSKLVEICSKAGMKEARTYIQSGNVICKSPLSEKGVALKLEKALDGATGRKIGVIVRDAREIVSVLEENPFPKAKPSLVGVYFFSSELPKGFMREVVADVEEVVAGKREVYVHFPNGMGRTKLKLPAEAKTATVRNINTVANLAALARKE